MFSRVSSFVRQAAEVLAPSSLSPRDEFRSHWKGITTLLIESKDDRVPVQETKIPKNLTKMLTLLIDEDKHYGDNTGPCLEFLLQHKILETLFTLGRGDTPPGMKTQVLRFFSTLLTSIKHPLLPQVHVHKPVQRLIKCCGNVTAGPTELEEVDFLLTLCQKFRSDSSLANFFLETYSSVSPGPNQKSKPVFRFHLLSALLELSSSADVSVAMKAYEGLIVCVSLPEETVALAIANNSKYCQQVVQHLAVRFTALPSTLDDIDIARVTAKWGFNLANDFDWGDAPKPSAVQHIEYLLQWLDYINQVMKLAHPIISNRIAQNIQKDFLENLIIPKILQPNEEGALTSIAYISRMLECIDAGTLVEAFATFFIGNDVAVPEERRATAHQLRHKLIQKCDHMSDELSIAYMQFFSVLLSLPCQQIITNLVTRNLNGRLYNAVATSNDLVYLSDKDMYKKYGLLAPDGKVPLSPQSKTEFPEDLGSPPPPPDSATSPSPSEDDAAEALGFRFSPVPVQTQAQSSSDAESRASSSVSASTIATVGTMVSGGHRDEGEIEFKALIRRTGGGVLIRDLARMRIVCSEDDVEKLVDRFLSILPEDVASTSPVSDTMTFEAYMADASREVSSCFAMCSFWQREEPPDDERSEFYEGFFLDMLLNRLQRLLDQPYEVNLVLTRLLIQISRFPHPTIHEYLFDANVQLAPNSRSVFSILCQLCVDIAQKRQKLPDFVQSFAEARQRLTSQESTGIQSSPNHALFDNVVLLEEFSKELAATLYTKSMVSLQEA
ncbi:FHF complex subunit HOOK interacting protein 2A-like [Oscarella lobularis]|uniref:FHF complex subunit HOOK interacting protein 2A-like n=1 Tax=Oscarella lobularis TaxID=121494 RepID=UPI0033135B8A